MQKRLWLGAAGVVLFFGTILIASAVVNKNEPTARVAGLDFLSFYTAGTAVREGRTADLYSLPAARAFQVEVARREGFELGTRYAPWWNPPFFALVFVPLSRLAFFWALGIWLAVGLICAAVSCRLLCRMLPYRDWRTWGLVPVLMVVSMPFINTLTHGQNTCVSLLILTAAVWLWRSNRAFVAGLVGGLLAYKPQLALVIAVVMIWDLGWRVALGYLVMGTVLLAINVIMLPGTLAEFLHRVPENLAYIQWQTTYPWERHVTFKAFWRVLLDGTAVGPTTAIVQIFGGACLVAMLLLLIVVVFRQGKEIARDRLIAATIAATPLLMPFYFDYDLLLLAIPTVLLARDWNASSHLDRWAFGIFSALFAWLLINPDFAIKTRLNLAVPLLAGLAVLLIVRVSEPPARSTSLR